MMTVTVYSTGSSCIRCTMTKRVLDQKSIEFAEVNIRDNGRHRPGSLVRVPVRSSDAR